MVMGMPQASTGDEGGEIGDWSCLESPSDTKLHPILRLEVATGFVVRFRGPKLLAAPSNANLPPRLPMSYPPTLT